MFFVRKYIFQIVNVIKLRSPIAVSEYRALTDRIFTSSIVYFHGVVSFLRFYVVNINNESGFVTFKLYYFWFFAKLIYCLITIYCLCRTILLLFWYLILNLIDKCDFVGAFLSYFLCLFSRNNRYTHTIMAYFWKIILNEVGIINSIWLRRCNGFFVS